jgi:hypothetical protein
MDIDAAHQKWKDHAAGCPTCAADPRPSERCPTGEQLTFYADLSNIRTYVGPYPPSRRKDYRTFIWSTCTVCGWYACHLEDQQSMQHTIETFDHARSGCAEQGQLSLFAET